VVGGLVALGGMSIVGGIGTKMMDWAGGFGIQRVGNWGWVGNWNGNGLGGVVTCGSVAEFLPCPFIFAILSVGDWSQEGGIEFGLDLLSFIKGIWPNKFIP